MSKTEKVVHGVYFPTADAMIDKTNLNQEVAVQSELLELREQMEKSKYFFIRATTLSSAACDSLIMLGYDVQCYTDQDGVILSYEISWKPTSKEVTV